MYTFKYKLTLFQILKIHFQTRIDRDVLAINFLPIFGTKYNRICIPFKTTVKSPMWFLLVSFSCNLHFYLFFKQQPYPLSLTKGDYVIKVSENTIEHHLFL